MAILLTIACTEATVPARTEVAVEPTQPETSRLSPTPMGDPTSAPDQQRDPDRATLEPSPTISTRSSSTPTPPQHALPTEPAPALSATQDPSRQLPTTTPVATSPSPTTVAVRQATPTVVPNPTATAVPAPTATPVPTLAPTPRPTPGTISRSTNFVPLDEPAYVGRDQASSNIKNSSYVLGVENNGEARAYPLDMMWYHHIANDTVGGEPWLVTY